MNIKTALVTGASGAIGKAIARQIAQQGYKVTLMGRDEERAKRNAEEIKTATGNPEIFYVIADVSDKSRVFNLAAAWEGTLHVLVNNAAVTPRSLQFTHDKIEVQWATNVLGYFWMIKAFTEILKKSAPSRIINVASYWAGGLDLEDPEFRKRKYNNDVAYRQSKQANRMLTVAFAEQLIKDQIFVNACHPGDVNSKLSNNLGFGGSESPDAGAKTPAWLATGEEGGKVTGKYFEHMRETNCQFSRDTKNINKLYLLCDQY